MFPKTQIQIYKCIIAVLVISIIAVYSHLATYYDSTQFQGSITEQENQPETEEDPVVSSNTSCGGPYFEHRTIGSIPVKFYKASEKATPIYKILAFRFTDVPQKDGAFVKSKSTGTYRNNDGTYKKIESKIQYTNNAVKTGWICGYGEETVELDKEDRGNWGQVEKGEKVKYKERTSIQNTDVSRGICTMTITQERFVDSTLIQRNVHEHEGSCDKNGSNRADLVEAYQSQEAVSNLLMQLFNYITVEYLENIHAIIGSSADNTTNKERLFEDFIQDLKSFQVAMLNASDPVFDHRNKLDELYEKAYQFKKKAYFSPRDQLEIIINGLEKDRDIIIKNTSPLFESVRPYIFNYNVPADVQKVRNGFDYSDRDTFFKALQETKDLYSLSEFLPYANILGWNEEEHIKHIQNGMCLYRNFIGAQANQSGGEFFSAEVNKILQQFFGKPYPEYSKGEELFNKNFRNISWDLQCATDEEVNETSEEDKSCDEELEDIKKDLFLKNKAAKEILMEKAKGKIENMDRKINEINQSNAKIKTIKDEISQNKEIMQQAFDRFLENDFKIQNSEGDIDRLRVEQQQLLNNIGQSGIIANNIRDNQNDISNLQEKITNLRKEKNDIQNDLDNIVTNDPDVSKAYQEITERENAINNKIKECGHLDQQIKKQAEEELKAKKEKEENDRKKYLKAKQEWLEGIRKQNELYAEESTRQRGKEFAQNTELGQIMVKKMEIENELRLKEKKIMEEIHKLANEKNISDYAWYERLFDGDYVDTIQQRYLNTLTNYRYQRDNLELDNTDFEQKFQEARMAFINDIKDQPFLPEWQESTRNVVKNVEELHQLQNELKNTQFEYDQKRAEAKFDTENIYYGDYFNVWQNDTHFNEGVKQSADIFSYLIPKAHAQVIQPCRLCGYSSEIMALNEQIIAQAEVREALYMSEPIIMIIGTLADVDNLYDQIETINEAIKQLERKISTYDSLQQRCETIQAQKESNGQCSNDPQVRLDTLNRILKTENHQTNETPDIIEVINQQPENIISEVLPDEKIDDSVRERVEEVIEEQPNSIVDEIIPDEKSDNANRENILEEVTQNIIDKEINEPQNTAFNIQDLQSDTYMKRIVERIESDEQPEQVFDQLAQSHKQLAQQKSTMNYDFNWSQKTKKCNCDEEQKHYSQLLTQKADRSESIETIVSNIISIQEEMKKSTDAAITNNQNALQNALQESLWSTLNEANQTYDYKAMKAALENARQKLNTCLGEVEQNYQNDQCQNSQQSFKFIPQAHASNLPICPSCNQLNQTIESAKNDAENLNKIINSLERVILNFRLSNLDTSNLDQVLTDLELEKADTTNIEQDLVEEKNSCLTQVAQLKQEALCILVQKEKNVITDARCDQECNIDLIRINRKNLDSVLTNLKNETKILTQSLKTNESSDTVRNSIKKIINDIDRIENGYKSYTANMSENIALSCIQNKIAATTSGLCYGRNKCDACDELESMKDIFNAEGNHYKQITSDILKSFVEIRDMQLREEKSELHNSLTTLQTAVEISINEILPFLIERSNGKNLFRFEYEQCENKVSQLSELNQCTLDGIVEY